MLLVQAEKQKPSPDRARRNAERLEALCNIISNNGVKITAESTEEQLAELRTLCAMIPGTPVFHEYILELLDTDELQLDGALAYFFVDAAKGVYGVYEPPVSREFERLTILSELPRKISEAANQHNEERVIQLQELVDRWTKSFEKKYQQPVDNGVNLEALAQHLRRINESGENENMGSLSE